MAGEHQDHRLLEQFIFAERRAGLVAGGHQQARAHRCPARSRIAPGANHLAQVGAQRVARPQALPKRRPAPADAQEGHRALGQLVVEMAEPGNIDGGAHTEDEPRHDVEGQVAEAFVHRAAAFARPARRVRRGAIRHDLEVLLHAALMERRRHQRAVAPVHLAVLEEQAVTEDLADKRVAEGVREALALRHHDEPVGLRADQRHHAHAHQLETEDRPEAAVAIEQVGARMRQHRPRRPQPRDRRQGRDRAALGRRSR